MLQAVATRLQSLEILDSRLRGSAHGFLSAGWIALTHLNLCASDMEDDVLTAVNLPAVELLDIIGFGHQGGMLQVDQLSCPQLRMLGCQLDSSLARASEGSRQWFNLLHLNRLADLELKCSSVQATMDLGLPASLQHLAVQDSKDTDDVDLKWVLREVVKGIRSGVNLGSLNCAGTAPSSHPEGMPWGDSSVAHYGELGKQLRGPAGPVCLWHRNDATQRVRRGCLLSARFSPAFGSVLRSSWMTSCYLR